MAEARALLGLSELELASADPRQAVLLGQQAAGVFGNLKAPLYEVRALVLLSDAYTALGDVDAAEAAAAEAAVLRSKNVGDQPIAQ